MQAIATQARLHDAYGYDRVLIANAAVMPDNISTAGYVAAVTERLGVMLAHRPGFIAPTMAARLLATLDLLLKGRLAVHIITAASDIETQADGDYLTKAQRYDRSREYIAILRQIWAATAPVDHQGDWYRFTGGFAAVKATKPGIPVYFGGLSPEAIAVGAECADTFATLSDTVAGMAEVVGKVRAAAPAGRNPRFLMSIRVVLGETEDDAWASAEGIERRIRDLTPPPVAGAAKPVAVGFQRTATLAQAGDRLEKCFWNGINKLRGGQSNSGTLVGTPDQLVDALMDYYAAGVSGFIVRGYHGLRDVERVGREIIPALRAAAAAHDARGATAG
ncbi:LLM class flavin-dependent oxidoreductase [Nitrospirillum sp. BR 11828]|uniref:LLM class flavin-dependent oxidoreductase n=1 Tax=Nitrospirillum sp. BR 11828 TaxID=3104325 RepID=UPI002ACA15FB|nr:LLM class flavin-dependent oxidoreductase [Nitrospirillum sp. BR 11828]MDZ5645874.1 LLM class flavin-dependent oxidoreductase [Nitrospirillum sp. BR 11828]